MKGNLKMAFGGACCTWCVKAVKWLPVLFIVAIVVWSYYAYVVQLCICTVKNLIEKVLYLFFFHISFIVFCWTYWKTIFSEIGRIPKEFYLPPADVEKLEREENEDNQRRIIQKAARNLPVACRTIKGDFRYCEKCKSIKPDRAHHCSVCGICVLKMDHHCPWVNNCVGFTNYKYFVLFLGYGLVYCVFIALTVLEYFIKFWSENLGSGKFHILFLFFVSIMFAISLVSLFGYHCYLIAQNRTTLESFRAPVFYTGPDKDGFSLGKYCNFLEVFGEFRKKWFLPVFTSNGDGVTFPTHTPQVNSYNSMGATQPPSFGDGVSFPTRTIDDDTDTLLGNRQRWIEEGETELPTIQQLDRAAPKTYKIEDLSA